jgi:hypothetical protein
MYLLKVVQPNLHLLLAVWLPPSCTVYSMHLLNVVQPNLLAVSYHFIL